MLTQVADDVLVHRSGIIQSNAVIVRGPAGVLLVDPGITGVELVGLAADLEDSGLSVVAGFATHPDWDHVLWHPALGNAPRYGTERCAAELRDLLSRPDWRARVTEVLPPEAAEDLPFDLFGMITGLPAGATRLPWDGPEVRILEHRAHAVGHAALLIRDRGVLVAGDMLSDVLVPMLDLGAADPIGDYLAALELLDGAASDVDVVIPGHGSVGTGDEVRARIAQDRTYVQALRDGREPGDTRIGATAMPGWEWVSDVHSWQVQRLRHRAEVEGTVI